MGEIPPYIKKAIPLLYKGDSSFYLELNEEIFRGLTNQINKKLKRLISGEKVWKLIEPSKKTITNTGFSKEKIQKIFAKRFKKISAKYWGREKNKFSFAVKYNHKEIKLSPVEFANFVMSLGKYVQYKAGSIRSEWGKILKETYLRKVFKILNILEGDIKSITSVQEGTRLLSKKGTRLYYILNEKFLTDNGIIMPDSKGGEIDGLVYLYNRNEGKIEPLLIIEFTVSGVGNPSFQQNKAIGLWRKWKNTGATLLYTGFDLSQSMRDKLPSVETIFFKEDIGLNPLLKIRSLLSDKLEKMGIEPAKILATSESAKNKMEKFIKSLKK